MPAHPDMSNLRRILGGLLDDPAFLPEEGNLRLGLRHRHPLPTLYSGWCDHESRSAPWFPNTTRTSSGTLTWILGYRG